MPISEKWIPQLQQLIAQGLSNTEIARVLNKNPHAVSDRIRLSGLRIQRRGGPSGSWNGVWKGGIRETKDGYIEVRFDHPRNTLGYCREHILVMESHLGRLLQEDEVVHHRNGNRKDNNIDNLELFASNAEHLRAELSGNCPEWSLEGWNKLILPKAEQAIAKRVSNYHPKISEGGHHCSGFENHPLLQKQPLSVQELAKKHF